MATFLLTKGYVDGAVAEVRSDLDARIDTVEAALSGLEAPDLSAYATRLYVDEAVANVTVPPPDLTPYALDTDLADHAADTLAVHGIADTERLITQDNIGVFAPPADLTGVARLGEAQTFTQAQTISPSVVGDVGLTVHRSDPSPATAFRIDRYGALLAEMSGNRIGPATSPGSTGLTVSGASASQKGLVAKGLASQTGDIFSVLDSANTTLAAIASTGAFSSRSATINSRAASASVLNVVGDSAQTGNLQEWKKSGGAVTASVNSEGRGYFTGLLSANPITIDTAGIGLSVRNTDTGTLTGAGIVGRYANDFPAAGYRLGYYLMGGSTLNQAGMSGWAEEGWTGSARGSSLTFETTALGTTGRREVGRFSPAGDLSVLGGITSAGETVPRSGTINGQTADVMVNQVPGVRNGVVVKVDGPPTGVYGQDQAFMVLKEGSAAVEPDDLVVFRVDHRGAMGFAGGAHVATGLRARPGDTYQYSIHINPSVDVPGLLVDSANDAPTSAWQQWRLHNGTVLAEMASDQWFKTNRGLYSIPRAGDQPAVVVQQHPTDTQTRSLIEFKSVTGTTGSSIGADTLTFRPTYLENEAKNSPIVALFPTGVTVQARTATQAAVIMKGAASQSANLQEWQDSGGVVRSYMAPGGNLFATTFLADVAATGSYISMGGTTAQIQNRTVGNIPLTVAGIAGQTADVQRWIIAPSTVLGGVEPDGDIRIDASGKGLRLRSPDGLIRRTLTIDNAGNLALIA